MAWFDSNWQYRKEITVNGETGAGTNYQVKLEVGESSGSSNSDFHLENNSESFPSEKNDGGDIRLTSSDGETELDFWVENVSGSSPDRVATIWVKITENLDTDKDIYIYYGNSNASNISDGDNTFLFFDDFEGSSLDTSKWLDDGDAPPVIENDYFKLNHSTTVYGEVYSKYNWKNYTAQVIGRGRLPSTTQAYHFFWGTSFNSWDDVNQELIGAENTAMHSCSYKEKEGYYRFRVDGTTGDVISRDDGFVDNELDFELKIFDGKVEFYKDGVLKRTEIDNFGEFDSTLRARRYGSSGTNGDLYMDYIFSRKCIETEPTFSTVGSEETEGPVEVTSTGFMAFM